MGLLDELVGGGNLGSVADLVAKNPGLLDAAKSLLDPKDPSVGGSSGLGDLLGGLRGEGMGDLVSSWLGQGANRPLGADHVTNALSADTLRQFAEKAGIDLGSAAGALAAILPMLIDKLSPDGREPAGDSLGGLLRQLL